MVHNDNNPHTICVNFEAVQALFQQGDWFGEYVSCEQGIVIQKSEIKLSNEKTSEEFSIYPNPTSSIKRIIIETTVEKADISIFDISGKLIRKGILDNNDIEWDTYVANASAGLYIIQLKNEYLDIRKKLILLK